MSPAWEGGFWPMNSNASLCPGVLVGRLGLVPRNRSVLSDSVAHSDSDKHYSWCLGGVILEERYNSLRRSHYVPSAKANSQFAEK